MDRQIDGWMNSYLANFGIDIAPIDPKKESTRPFLDELVGNQADILSGGKLGELLQHSLVKMCEISMMRLRYFGIGGSLTPVAEIAVWTQIENVLHDRITWLAVAKLKMLNSVPHK